jgi:hypothetical protein
MTGKFGMFDTEAERDAWVAERDRHIALEAEQLEGIGIKDADDLVGKYSALCDLYERVRHGMDLTADPDDVLMTSDEAREFASRVLEIMQGADQDPREISR